MEWYDPAAITTKDGSLVITLSEKETHDLHYQGGMMSTWNKFCFTGGILEGMRALLSLLLCITQSFFSRRDSAWH